MKDAPDDDATVVALKEASSAATDFMKTLNDRTAYWNEFVAARDDADQQLEKLQNTVDQVLEKPPRKEPEVLEDQKRLVEARVTTEALNNQIMNLQRLSELLNPLETAFADVRFLNVDAEQVAKQYDDLIECLQEEVETNTVIKDSSSHILKELEALQNVVDNSPSSETLENIASDQIPALQDQFKMMEAKVQETVLSNKHLKPESEILSKLQCRMAELAELVDKERTRVAEQEKEELKVILTMKITQLESQPIQNISPNMLQELEEESQQLSENREIADKLRHLKEKRETYHEELEEAEIKIKTAEESLRNMTGKDAGSGRK